MHRSSPWRVMVLLGSEGGGKVMEDTMKGSEEVMKGPEEEMKGLVEEMKDSEEDMLKKKRVPVPEVMWMVVEYVVVWPFMCHVGLVLFVAWMASCYHFNVPFISVLGFIYLFQACIWLNATYSSIYVCMDSFSCFCECLYCTFVLHVYVCITRLYCKRVNVDENRRSALGDGGLMFPFVVIHWPFSPCFFDCPF